ncbi:cyclophilin-type peptidyl-prolyl cis-trans isomerase [Scenedesmus sp. NREL 46B-D3]|nr:cyclophilin-type peptidyl-prolyl cis-trans isomerase [Scenedesmus sp. NREL 46B-D3]
MHPNRPSKLAQSSGAMRRVSSAATLSNLIISARSRMGSSLHAIIILTIMVVLFALSMFMTPQHQHLKAAMLAPHVGQDPMQTATAAHAAAARAAAAQATEAAHGLLPSAAACHAEQGAEYGGDVVKWGENHLQLLDLEASVQRECSACCAACQAASAQGCNVWVWCGEAAGCGARKHQECWLKKQQDMRLTHIAGGRGTNWTSGALFDDAARSTLLAAEQARLQALHDDASLPLVCLDVAIKASLPAASSSCCSPSSHPGRPRIPAALHRCGGGLLQQLLHGEKGTVPEGQAGAGQRYSFRGRPFYRIIHGFINQAGAETDSVFGGQFKDDPAGLRLKHDRKGLLSMANTGPDSNTSHFSVMVDAAPHLDGHYTIFGEAVDGFEVIDAINALAVGQPDTQPPPRRARPSQTARRYAKGRTCQI